MPEEDFHLSIQTHSQTHKMHHFASTLVLHDGVEEDGLVWVERARAREDCRAHVIPIGSRQAERGIYVR